MRRFVYLILTSLFIACQSSDSVGTNKELTGTWKLISYCKSTGTSACTQTTVPNDKGVFISFSKKNEFNEYYQNTRPIDYSFLGCGGGSYAVEGSQVRIRAVCMSSSNGQLIDLTSLSQTRLVLNPSGRGEYLFEKQ